MNYEQTKRFLLTSLRRAHAVNDLEKAKTAILADLEELQTKKQKPSTPSAAATAIAASTTTTTAGAPTSTDQDVKDILDYALQVVLAEVCQRHDKSGAASSSEMEVEGAVPGRKYEDVGLLIDIALWLGREKMIESAASLELVRDFFLSHTIEECQQFFALLEDRADQLARAIVGDARANNTLLRALSEVRKRLSRTNDLVFAGRILMFMAYAFPLSDKSGVNLKGDANVANVTTVDKEASPALAETAEDKSESPVDWNFYQMFWGLQSYFLNPVKAFDAWQVVTGHLNSVLDLFKQYPISEEEASAASYSYAHPPAKSENYLTKYLTSSRLLRLQLRDPWFRRHIMVQFLVFFQALRVVSESSTVAQRLTEQQKNEIASLTKKTKTSLWETPPNGTHFTNTIYAILKRENNWTDWKKEGCPPFEKPPVPPLEAAAMRASREVRLNKKKKGLAALLEGESVRDLQALLQKEERGRVLSLEEWLQPVIEEMDPEAAIESQYKKINTDKIYVWRAHRLTFKHSLDYFCTLAKRDATLEDIAKQLVSSKATEVPSEEGMVLEDREDKRDNANADADDDDKEDEGAMDVKIEAKLNGSDQEDGQLPAVESETPGAVPIKEERGEDKDSQPQGEKRKEMPSSPLKIREDDDAASVTTKRRRVESSPLHGAPSASSPGDTTNATVGGASTASAAPRT